jgi:exodeoxyribonuclease V beta subunit
VTAPPAIFDVCGPLPTGRTLLEASAGTGKTFTIAALAARYVASGVPLEHLLVVTFTRAATTELRERVRERLVSAEAGLRSALGGIVPGRHDRVLAALADGAPLEVETRRRRLATALADFDAATIATTHGFCEHILSGLGVAGDVEREVTFVEDPSDLVAEVVDDLFLRHVMQRGYPGFDRREAGEIADRVVGHPTAAIEPSRAPAGSEWDKRARLGRSARMHVERRKLAAGLVTYDDLLTRLAGTLADPVRGPGACRRLQDRYWVALVDEFQDTDPVQWEILRLAFGAAPGPLVLIGDPKQAIYSFRGADVFAYLDAAATATTTATLATNWRSDRRLVEACQALFADATLGHPDIIFRTVEAAPTHFQPGLVAAPVTAALRFRLVHRLDGAVGLTGKGYVAKSSGEKHIAADLAGDLVALLASGSMLVSYDSDGTELRRRTLMPGNVAVLVRTNQQAAVVRDALDAVDVPAVINGAGSVFATSSALDWLRLVEALERPASPSRVRAAALTSFVGWTAEELAGAGEDAVDGLQATLYLWASVLERRGVAALFELTSRTTALSARMLAEVDGERRLTDLSHVCQLLHAEAITERLGTTALTGWLRRRISEADREAGAADRSRRLESDAEAVQVLTIHRSKGLEFPVVYLPFLWGDTQFDDRFLPVYHDQASGLRTVDVGGQGGPDNERHRRWRQEEERGEDLRLAYVALTRARNQVVLWWAGSWDSRCSPLGRLLFGRDANGNVLTELKSVPTDNQALECLDALAARSGGTIAVERVGTVAGDSWGGQGGDQPALGVRSFARTLDVDWQRTSYSSLTAGAHDPAVGSEAELSGISDEMMPALPDIGGGASGAGDAGAGDEERLRAVPSLWGSIPRGADTGTLVHAVLETTDFAVTGLESELATRIGEQIARQSPGFPEADTLAAAVRTAIETPLGPLAGDVSLRGVTMANRLNELSFELPVAGGDTPVHEVTVRAVASLLKRRVPGGDPLAGYADVLAGGVADQRLRGYLTGSIDLVLRFPGRPDRFAVVDYKTNWLGRTDEPLSAWQYRPAAMAAAMVAAHYPLQAMLYSVALHRYLRWRVPDYHPDRHLLGVLYLFVRGMTGRMAPRVDGQPCGVFAWQPPVGLVAELSDLLDRGAVTE